jgi:hypothetical protein
MGVDLDVNLQPASTCVKPCVNLSVDATMWVLGVDRRQSASKSSTSSVDRRRPASNVVNTSTASSVERHGIDVHVCIYAA